MADIAWSAYALAMFTPEERAAAAAVVPPGDFLKPPVGPIPVGLPPAAPLLPPAGALGRVDPDQMWADGFIYWNGQWVKGNADMSAPIAGGAPKPTAASFTSASSFGGGSVLGVQVPSAPAVLLPSFVGGRVGTVRRSGGLRPESGGGPRIVKGIGPRPRWLGVVRP